jgi:hypothetical protein
MNTGTVPAIILWAALGCYVEGSGPGPEETIEGAVVSAKGQDLVMTDAQGRRHAFLVGESAKIIVYGKPGKLEDLTRGTMIRVTTARDGRVLAVETVRSKESASRPA